MSDADGKFTVVAELAVDLSVGAVDHLTGHTSHLHLRDTETLASVTTSSVQASESLPFFLVLFCEKKTMT